MIEIYRKPLAYEALQFPCSFSPALAEAPSSAVVWIERLGVTTEHAATLAPGATTTAATVTFVPDSAFADAGKYNLAVRFKNAGGVTIARTVPQQINALSYPSEPV